SSPGRLPCKTPPPLTLRLLLISDADHICWGMYSSARFIGIGKYPRISTCAKNWRGEATRKMESLTPQWSEYELVDSGDGKKLERFGEFTLVRPEPQAKWAAGLPEQRWETADGEFVKAHSGQRGQWKLRKAT